MTREFIETEEFSKDWRNMGLGDDELARLQTMLTEDPKAGYVISGAGNAREIRFALGNRGKRCSARVIYSDCESSERLFLLEAFTKKDKNAIIGSDKFRMRSTLSCIAGKAFNVLHVRG